MMKLNDPSATRREVLKGAGAFIVTVGMADGLVIGPAAAQIGAAPAAAARALAPTQLDSWIALAPDGKVTAFFGKMDCGQGLDTAIAQIVADELDVRFADVTVVMGDTATTLNQGGGSASTGVRTGAVPLRYAAAEARRLLLDAAAQRLGVPVDRLAVQDGTVSVIGDPAKRVGYGELMGGKQFSAPLEWNNEIGNTMKVQGKAQPKTPDQYKIVGNAVPRNDIAPKVFGRAKYVVDVVVPGMVHGRTIRPPVAGAKPVAVDENSLAGIPNVRVVSEGDFLGVVAPNEWDAINAARRLRVTWSNAAPPFPEMAGLYDHIRQAPVLTRKVELEQGQVASALAGAARRLRAEYEFPFQSHASIAPGCGVADIRDGGGTFWTGTQKPHYTRQGIAKLLKIPEANLRAIWVQGPGSYGRNDADDAVYDAALMSRAVGKPVRVQYSRAEGTGWDPKGPAAVLSLEAGLDADGKVVAYKFNAKGFSGRDTFFNASNPKDTLAGMQLGIAAEPVHFFGVPSDHYGFASRELAWETIAPLLAQTSPLRTAHLRAPQQPQIVFAHESFLDELAAAVGADPIEFRLRYMTDPRGSAVIKAATERFGWQKRHGGSPTNRTGDVLTGRGFAYASEFGAYVATAVEVEIERKTGRVWAKRFAVGHDCGLVINPAGLKTVIEGNIIQSTSRTLREEVRFDRKNVTSVDWNSYPILDMLDAPEAIDIAMVEHREVAPGGAGECASVPTFAAIANAIHDATGVRMRSVPFTPQRMKAALA